MTALSSSRLARGASNAAANQRQPIKASQVDAMIDRQGAGGTLRELLRDEKVWRQVLERIAAGSNAWLRVAARLEPGSDAGAAEDLAIAVQDALPNAPEQVLRLVKGGAFTVGHACGGYGSGQIEDRRPKRTILALIHKRQEAVQGVGETTLADTKRACLELLAGQEYYIRHRTPWPPQYD